MAWNHIQNDYSSNLRHAMPGVITVATEVGGRRIQQNLTIMVCKNCLKEIEGYGRYHKCPGVRSVHDS